MKPSGKWTLVPWIAMALVLGAADVFVVLWTPGEGEYESPWALPIITFFLLVVLYVILTEVMRSKVVVEMRGPDTSSPALDEPGTAEDHLPPAPLRDDRSPPPLRVEMSTPEQVLAGSLHDNPVAARARRAFDHGIAIHRGAVYFLVAANLLIAFMAMWLQQPFPLPGMAGMVLVGAPLALSFLGVLVRRKSRLTIDYAAWVVLHGTWAVATCFVAGSYIVTTVAGVLRTGDVSPSTLSLAALSAVAILLYAWRVAAARRRLRREVLAEPPIRLLFLWVFGDGLRINSLLLGIGAVWRCVGPLQFLQGGGMIGMGADTIRYFSGRGRPLVAESDREVDARIAEFEWAPRGWWSMYATNTLLCGDRSWRHALERLLDTDLVLMDLCGFSSENAGCVYELGQIVDRIPTSRFVPLVDASTDLDALRATLETAWARMDPASPNRRPDCDPIRLFRCDSEYDRKGHAFLGNMQRNADGIVDLLCAGVDGSLEGPAPRPRIHR